MGKQAILALRSLPAPLELLRMAIVCGCALALILAGRALPF